MKSLESWKKRSLVQISFRQMAKYLLLTGPLLGVTHGVSHPPVHNIARYPWYTLSCKRIVHLFSNAALLRVWEFRPGLIWIFIQ